MNRNIILIALLGLLFVSKAVAQSVTVEAKIDSLQIPVSYTHLTLPTKA